MTFAVIKVNELKVICQTLNRLKLHFGFLSSLPGWGNEDELNMAPLNKPYYDTNMALFTLVTLSMHMLAISHWLSHIIDVAGKCKRHAWVIN